ncbi:trafficking protein particle complex subunit 12-like [Liolophura sinensis]|uniref:trafficking protein particle complex subunit 12-like n=1 Tax=Liolophura sinensis TaxID=3198878 RepID=UPI0031586009
MADLPQLDPNISICLDDAGEERATSSVTNKQTSDENPSPDFADVDRASALVHSPTTDTLDSVALEPSPSDDEAKLSEVGEDDRETAVNSGENSQDQEDCQQSEETLQGLTNESETDKETVTVAGKTRESLGRTKDAGNPVESEQYETPRLSHYFGDSLSGDFFDGLTGEEGDPTSAAALVSTDTPKRTRHCSQPEPEPVSFEGEEPSVDNTKQVDVDEQALLEKETDAFESFTAEGTDIPNVENLSVSPIHQTFGTPRHFQSDSFPPVQDTLHSHNEEHGEAHLSTEASVPSVEKEDAQKLQLICTRPTGDQLSPLPSPSHKTPPLQPQQTGGPAPASPAHQSQAPFQQFSENFLTTAEDPFTASLHMSDADRRRDAWLPSEHTRQVIVSMVTSAPGTYYPSPDELCMPGLVLDDPQGDPVLEMLGRFSGEEQVAERKTLSADDVSQDDQGVRRLIAADCLRAAVDLVGRLITSAGQGVGRIGQVTQHTPHTLQLWFLRLTLLTKLRLYSLAESESQAFKNLDTADLYYDYYPQLHPGKRGSMVPFGMRILHANLPHFLGRTQDALDRLYYILAVVKKIVSNLESGGAEDGSLLELSAESRKASLELWRKRELQVLYSTGNSLLSVKDFEAGLEVYESLLEKDKANHSELLCALGRIYLQMGDIDKASSYFKQFDDECSNRDNVMTGRIAISHGLVALSRNNFNEAYQYFTTAKKADPTNPIAVNNLAVCYLYMGKLKESLATLEGMIQSDPSKNLHEGVLFNLCTLYELESSRASQKKASLLEMVSKHKGDSFPVASLKLA